MARAIDYALYLVTDRVAARGRGLVGIVRAAVQGGASVVQIRDKDTSTRDTLRLALELKALLDPLGVPLIVNDRIDLALACGAAGVHLGQEDMPCDLARRLVGAECLLGVSVSTPEEARRATGEGADYLGLSPVFGPPTKPSAASMNAMRGRSWRPAPMASPSSPPSWPPRTRRRQRAPCVWPSPAAGCAPRGFSDARWRLSLSQVTAALSVDLGHRHRWAPHWRRR